jgi:hypothetical protein
MTRLISRPITIDRADLDILRDRRVCRPSMQKACPCARKFDTQSAASFVVDFIAANAAPEIFPKASPQSRPLQAISTAMIIAAPHEIRPKEFRPRASIIHSKSSTR